MCIRDSPDAAVEELVTSRAARAAVLHARDELRTSFRLYARADKHAERGRPATMSFNELLAFARDAQLLEESVAAGGLTLAALVSAYLIVNLCARSARSRGRCAALERKPRPLRVRVADGWRFEHRACVATTRCTCSARRATWPERSCTTSSRSSSR